MLRPAALGLVCLMLAACESQQPARELAANASANTAQLSATLSQAAASERRVAKTRASTLATYDRAVRESKTALAFDIAITRKSGDRDAIDRLTELQQWIAEAERAAAVEGGTAAEGAVTLLAQQQALDTKAEQLAAIAKALDELAKEQGAPASAAFLKGYIEEVFALLEAAKETAESAEKDAESPATAIKNSTTTLPKSPSAVTSP